MSEFKIEQFIKAAGFWKKSTGKEVSGFYNFMHNVCGIPKEKAISWLSRLIDALKNEYGD